VTKIIYLVLINLVTPKARAKHEPLVNEPATAFPSMRRLHRWSWSTLIAIDIDAILKKKIENSSGNCVLKWLNPCTYIAPYWDRMCDCIFLNNCAILCNFVEVNYILNNFNWQINQLYISSYFHPLHHSLKFCKNCQIFKKLLTNWLVPYLLIQYAILYNVLKMTIFSNNVYQKIYQFNVGSCFHRLHNSLHFS